MTELHLTTWNTGADGIPAVLVHGSLATGADEWQAQRELSGHALIAPDRRGYGRSPAVADPLADGEDAERDADDLVALIDDVDGGEGVHLVGHSYGGIGVMLAAARRPDSVRSIALLEPPALTLAPPDGPGRELLDALRAVWSDPAPDHVWVQGFLAAVGTDAAELPAEVLDGLVPLVGVLRRGRPPWDVELPVAELAAVTYPKLVVSGGHDAGFDAVCDELARCIGARRCTVAGAGHEIQFADGINDVLVDLWATAGALAVT